MMQYSQAYEDKIIERVLGHIEHGKYVDIGAGDALLYSNTYSLYLKGWRGICVDPLYKEYASHVEKRPEDINIHTAISNYDGEIDMCETATLGSYIGDQYSTVGMLDGYHPPVRKERCMTMNTLLSMYPEYWNADLFTIDIETNEHKALECCDFLKFTPKLIIIEYLVRNVDYRSNWIHYIDPHYELLETVSGNAVYLRKSNA